MKRDGLKMLANDPGFLLLTLVFVVGSGFAGHHVNLYVDQQLRATTMNNLKMVGLACNVFENSNADHWPAVSFSPRPFSLDPSDLDPTYDAANRLISTAKRRRNVSVDRREFYYLGYACRDEEMALAYLDAIRENGPSQALARRTIQTPAGPAYPLKSGIESHLKYLEKLERYGNTYMGCGPRGISDMPVLIEHPDLYGDGGHVLYFDGHVEFVAYPGKFPMTERFIAALESFEAGE